MQSSTCSQAKSAHRDGQRALEEHANLLERREVVFGDVDAGALLRLVALFGDEWTRVSGALIDLAGKHTMSICTQSMGTWVAAMARLAAVTISGPMPSPKDGRA